MLLESLQMRHFTNSGTKKGDHKPRLLVGVLSFSESDCEASALGSAQRVRRALNSCLHRPKPGDSASRRLEARGTLGSEPARVPFSRRPADEEAWQKTAFGNVKRAGRSVPAFLARRAERESAVRLSAATIEIC